MIKDLKFGQHYENIVANYFTNKGHSVKQSVGKFKPFDIIVDNKHKLEIKADKHNAQLVDNPNVVIEAYCNKQKSGILTTEAKYLIYFFTIKNEVYKINVEKLKNYIMTDEIKPRLEKFTNSDGQRASGYLLKIQDLIELNIAKKLLDLI